MSSRERTLRANLATEYRKRDRDAGRILDLRRELAAQQTADQICRILGDAPPLTLDQRRELVGLVVGDASADLHVEVGRGA